MKKDINKKLIGLVLAGSVFAGGAGYTLVAVANQQHGGEMHTISLESSPTPTEAVAEVTQEPPAVTSEPTIETAVEATPAPQTIPAVTSEPTAAPTSTPTPEVPLRATITVTPTPANEILGKVALTGITGKMVEANGLQLKITDGYKADVIAFHERGKTYQTSGIYIVVRGTYTNTGTATTNINLREAMQMDFGGPYISYREDNVSQDLQQIYYSERPSNSLALEPGQSGEFASVYSLDKLYYGTNAKFVFKAGFPLNGQELNFGYTH